MMIAVDQHGQIVMLPGKHPRKELMERLGVKHASKMFIDTRDGGVFHIGYVISGRWFALYTPWQKPA